MQLPQLAAGGFVKVIVTTNFDRLLETALNEVGVVPTVLSSPDQVKGSLPLIHTQCCVLKIHGDYLDTRILNTPAELEEYTEEFDILLARIFDEFGLVVCGWSAAYDTALRNALYRVPSRRFTTYWAAHGGQPGDEAQHLIQHRQARVVSINSADDFFHAIQEHVQSLEEFSRPHPLSTAAAVGSLKRYLPDDGYRIRMADLIHEIVEGVMDDAANFGFDITDSPEPNKETVTARVRAYEAACFTLLSMAVVGGHWAEKEHYRVWRQALSRLFETPVGNGHPYWLGLQRYPGTLLLYALGLGAVESDRLEFLGKMFSTEIHHQNRGTQKLVQLVLPDCLFDSGVSAMRILEGMSTHRFPLSKWLCKVMRGHSVDMTPSLLNYELAFDKLEILIALSFPYHEGRLSSTDDRYRAPPGSFVSRHRNRERIIQEIEDSINAQCESSPFVSALIFGASARECLANIDAFKSFVIQPDIASGLR